MGINQFRPVLFSAGVKKQVRRSHLRVSILQTRGVRNPPAKCGTLVSRLPPQAARFKPACRKLAGLAPARHFPRRNFRGSWHFAPQLGS